MNEFIAGFEGSTISDWSTALCFLAIPVGLVLGWCWESWRTRNWTDDDWRKLDESR